MIKPVENHAAPESLGKLGYSHEEAAALLSISPRHLANLVKAGEIRRVKAMAKNIYPREELVRYLSENLV